jgi:hypothetical protein
MITRGERGVNEKGITGFKKSCPEVGGNVQPLGRKKEGDARGVTRDLSLTVYSEYYFFASANRRFFMTRTMSRMAYAI